MQPNETEWSLQKRLTTDWLSRDTVLINDEPLFLAGWEVMTSYRVNDSRQHWSEPSIDFLFLDHRGQMVVLELKRDIRTPREAWSVLCQVTHRAHVLAGGYQHARLEAAYTACRSGKAGRQVPGTTVPRLTEAHARAFDQARMRGLPGLPVRRVVMAKSFASSFSRIQSSFNSDGPEQVAVRLGRYRPRGEIKRYLELPQVLTLVDPAPVQAVTIDGGGLIRPSVAPHRS